MARRIINDIHLSFLPQRDLHIIEYAHDYLDDIINNHLSMWEEHNELGMVLSRVSADDHPTATHALEIDDYVLYLIVNTASIIVVDIIPNPVTPAYRMVA